MNRQLLGCKIVLLPSATHLLVFYMCPWVHPLVGPIYLKGLQLFGSNFEHSKSSLRSWCRICNIHTSATMCVASYRKTLCCWRAMCPARCRNCLCRSVLFAPKELCVLVCVVDCLRVSKEKGIESGFTNKVDTILLGFGGFHVFDTPTCFE